MIEELARQDGSLGWCTVVAAGYARLAGSLPDDVAAEIFGSGRSILAGTTNPSGKALAVPGGYRVTGRWSYGSFIGHSHWVLGNCVTHDAGDPRRDASGGPDFRLCLFPREQVEVFDIWRVGGLRATGSDDYQVTDLFVPEGRTIPLAVPARCRASRGHCSPRCRTRWSALSRSWRSGSPVPRSRR